MSARAKFRQGPNKGSDGFRIDLKKTAIVFGILLVAFAVGYGATALSFSQSTGSDVVTVPDVREFEFSRARLQMERADLEMVVADSFPNPNIPAGSILAQSPLPGQELAPGSPVEVFFSTGPRRPTVPVVAGMPLTLATRALRTAGFDVLVEEDSSAVPRGHAIGTEPAMGSPLNLPATVTLRISTGPPLVELPRVIGLPEAAARARLEELGLVVTTVLYQDRFGSNDGDVVDQSPLPQDSVEPGSTVQIRVATRDRVERNYDDEPIFDTPERVIPDDELRPQPQAEPDDNRDDGNDRRFRPGPFGRRRQ